MKRKIPVDFEEKVKNPPKIGGDGYPYRISAKDLMQNFRHCNLEIDETAASGLYLEETIAADGIRKVVLKGTVVSSESTHPWTPTPNGDAFINVSSGDLMTLRNDNTIGVSEPPAWVRREVASSYVGGSVEVTAATGYIYGTATQEAGDVMFYPDVIDHGIQIDRTIPADDVSVMFSETLPVNTSGDEFIFLIADVTLTSGVAAVTKRHCYDNPTMWHIDIPADTGP